MIDLDFILASSLSLGIAIESSIPLKPGNTSPISEYRDLKHWGFIASSISIAIELYRTLSSWRGVVGEAIYRLYNAGLKLHRFGNLNLGFLILSTPVILASRSLIGNMISKSDYRITPREVREILNSARDIMMNPNDYDSVLWIKRAIRDASPSYLSKYVGRGEDVFSDSVKCSLESFISVFKDHDIVLYEIYQGYKESYRIFNTLVESSRGFDAIDYGFLRELFIDLGSRYIDSHIARGKGLKYSIDILREFRIANRISSRIYKLAYLDHLDKDMKSQRANPGSLADILANAISIYFIYLNLS